MIFLMRLKSDNHQRLFPGWKELEPLCGCTSNPTSSCQFLPSRQWHLNVSLPAAIPSWIGLPLAAVCAAWPESHWPWPGAGKPKQDRSVCSLTAHSGSPTRGWPCCVLLTSPVCCFRQGWSSSTEAAELECCFWGSFSFCFLNFRN